MIGFEGLLNKARNKKTEIPEGEAPKKETMKKASKLAMLLLVFGLRSCAPGSTTHKEYAPRGYIPATLIENQVDFSMEVLDLSRVPAAESMVSSLCSKLENIRTTDISVQFSPYTAF